MACRGIRGAIQLERDESKLILAATRELLQAIAAANQLAVDDLAGVIFTATPDLTAASPARAARELGWVHTPLLCMQEMEIENALPRCIRVLILWNTDRSPEQIQHVYLGAARALRPDLMED